MKKYLLYIVIAVLVVLTSVCACVFWVKYPLKYKSTIEKYSQKYNLQPSLVAAVICTESRFNPTAASSAGACGLMQLMPATYNWIAGELELSEDIYDVENNINAGCYYIRYLLDKYNNLVYCLACYNAGEGVVQSWGSPDNFSVENIKYNQTYSYVKKVLKLQNLYLPRF